MLDYKNRMDRIAYDKFMASYDEDNKGIEMYDSAMSAIVMIPTEDTSLKYYMSRTKTGMDNMALHANGQLDEATEKLAVIDYNVYLADKMQNHTPSADQHEKAKTMIRSMEATLEEMASDIRKTDNSFTIYKARNYLSFSGNHVRFIERIDLGTSLVLAVFLLCIAYTAVFMRYFVQKWDKMR